MINVTYVIDEGPRIYIERINIIGNMRTKDYVIRREFRLAEGDAYNPLMVDQAKKRLQALGFFKTVEVKRRPGSAPDRVILDVEVVEQSTGELSFGAGYSTSEGVIGDISITERNLMGKGQFLRLRLSGSPDAPAGRLELHRAALPRPQPRGRLRPLPQEVDLTRPAGFVSSTTRRRLAPRLPDRREALAGDSYTFSRRRDLRRRADARRWRSRQAAGDYMDVDASGNSLTYDHAQRSQESRPAASFCQVGVDFAGLGGDVQYVSASAEARGYYPITDKITFVGRAIGGNIEGWGGQDVRLIDLFFKGGETIRGFDRRRLSDRAT